MIQLAFCKYLLAMYSLPHDDPDWWRNDHIWSADTLTPTNHVLSCGISETGHRCSCWESDSWPSRNKRNFLAFWVNALHWVHTGTMPSLAQGGEVGPSIMHPEKRLAVLWVPWVLELGDFSPRSDSRRPLSARWKVLRWLLIFRKNSY